MLKRICEISNKILRCASGDLDRLSFIKGIAAIFDEYSKANAVDIYLGDREKVNIFEYNPPGEFTIRKLRRTPFPFQYFNKNDRLDFDFKVSFSEWMNLFFNEVMLKKRKKRKSAENSLSSFMPEKAVCKDSAESGLSSTSRSKAGSSSLRSPADLDYAVLERKETEEGICFFKNDVEYGETPSADSKKFHSYYIIPFSINPENFAILVMKDFKRNCFDQANVSFFSKLIHVLSEGFSHQLAQDALKERVKELICLYQITQIANKPNLTINQVLQQIADILPSAMQYPEIAYARIYVDEKYYKSSPFRESKIKLSSRISSKYEQRGVLEVFYREKKIPSYGEVFLQEEENLLETVAKQIALIIERKQIEELNTRLQEQLRHADRLATIGQLSAGIAHEINEPLATILGFAQLVEKGEDVPQTVVDDARKIINATLHSREIVRKLMLFSRQMPPKKGKVDLNQIIDEGLYFLESRCQKSGIKIIKKPDPSIPEIYADPNQIHQILVNLIVNAIHAMPKGGKLILSTKNNNDSSVSIYVEDTGMGIKEDIRQKIFIPFFTTKSINQGTGLGLSVVHGIVSSHNGQINVKSEYGKGSAFEIKLPVTGKLREK